MLNSRTKAETPLLVIVGETASGKSALAMALAQQFDGEIVNADSWQIYQGFNVGTAKPTAAERQQIPHHLLDIATPTDDFTAAVYKDLANRAITEIAGRHKLPILVGGTGLYIDGVLYDFSFLPAGDPDQRAHLSQLTIKQLLALISQQGFDTTGIDTRNKRRLIRLLETGGQRPVKQALRGNTLVLGLKVPRKELRQRIERRTETMFHRSLKKEVQELANRYGWDNEAMKGIGYREFKTYFEGQISAGEVKRQIIKNTLDLAKRQRTWFKRHPEINWVGGYQEAELLVQKFWK